MERVKQAAQEANQSGPRVVFVGDGQVPQAIRDLFPGTEFVRPSDTKERIGAATDSRRAKATALAAILAAFLARSGPEPEPTPEPTPELTPEPAHTRRSTDDPRLDSIKPLAFAELDKIAAGHGLSFSDGEREALFALSKAFDPDTAKAAARTACAMFNKETQQ
jgi:hypothetical protein